MLRKSLFIIISILCFSLVGNCQDDSLIWKENVTEVNGIYSSIENGKAVTGVIAKFQKWNSSILLESFENGKALGNRVYIYSDQRERSIQFTYGDTLLQIETDDSLNVQKVWIDLVLYSNSDGSDIGAFGRSRNFLFYFDALEAIYCQNIELESFKFVFLEKVYRFDEYDWSWFMYSYDFLMNNYQENSSTQGSEE